MRAYLALMETEGGVFLQLKFSEAIADATDAKYYFRCDKIAHHN